MLKPVFSCLLRLSLALGLSFPCLAAIGQTDLVNPGWQNDSPAKLFISAWQQNFVLDEPLIIKVSLKNVSTEQRTFIFSPESSFSVEFNIFDRNRNLLEKRTGVAKLASADLKPDLTVSRRIQLYPDEEFTVKVDLNNGYAFRADGRYLVQAVFKDVFNREKIWSNPLWVNVKPNYVISQRLKTEQEISNREAQTVMTPEGTVSYLLDALKEKDWEGFFRYLNLEKIIMLYSGWAQRWQAADSDEARQDTLDDFKNHLKAFPEYNNLEAYRIQNIVFPPDPNQSVIHCYLRYNRQKIPVNNYLYTFHLQRKGNKWYLYNFETVITKEENWGRYDATTNPMGPTQKP